MSRFVLATAMLALAATTAGADVLECKLKVNSNAGGWITDLYYIEWDPGTGEARVMDGVIQHFEGAPIAATISEDTDKKTVFGWKVAAFNQGQNITMRYRAAYFKSTNAVTVKAFPDSAYSGEFEAQGKCRKV